MRILFPLLSLVIAASAFAANDKKDTAVALKGEYAPASGYKVYFSEDKSKFVNLSGYARLTTEWQLDNKKTATDKKITMPYFRLLADGQSDAQWSWHTRLDYSQGFSMSKKTTDLSKAYGAPSIYFARAYVNYKANDVLSIDMGRISNLIYRFDLLNQAAPLVSYGVMPKLTLGSFSLKMSANYLTPAQRISIDDKPGLYLASRAGYTIPLTKDYNFEFGMTAMADADHGGEKYIQYLPDLYFTGPSDLYALYQGLYKTFSKDSDDFQEHYFEAGLGINNFFFPDLNWRITKADKASKIQHDPGAELVLKHTANVSTLYNVTYENAFAELKANKNPKLTAFIHYDF